MELIHSKSGREVVSRGSKPLGVLGRGSKPGMTQEGTWQCVGGSHFWRPNPTGGQVTAPNCKEEGDLDDEGWEQDLEDR